MNRLVNAIATADAIIIVNIAMNIIVQRLFVLNVFRICFTATDAPVLVFPIVWSVAKLKTITIMFIVPSIIRNPFLD